MCTDCLEEKDPSSFITRHKGEDVTHLTCYSCRRISLLEGRVGSLMQKLRHLEDKGP